MQLLEIKPTADKTKNPQQGYHLKQHNGKSRDARTHQTVTWYTGKSRDTRASHVIIPLRHMNSIPSNTLISSDSFQNPRIKGETYIIVFTRDLWNIIRLKTGTIFPTDSTFFPGRCGEVIVNGKPVGIVGVLHPDVISRFDLNLPCAALEIDIEALI